MTLGTTLLLMAASAVQPVAYERLLEEYRRDQDVPGLAAAIVVGEQLVFAGGAGVRDLATRQPVTADTPFYLGSVSKVLTATLILGLAEDGRLPLDASLDFREQDDTPITARTILSHASGLPREGPFGYWFTAEFPAWPALAEFASQTPLEFEPGAAMRYSNIGYAVLGQLAAERLGTSYGEALERRLLGPLGMQSSGSVGPAPGVARGYTPPGRLIPSAERPFAGVGVRSGDRYLREYHDASAMAPAFGAWSTAADMQKFLGYLLSDANRPRPSKPERKKLYSAQASGWGLGMQPDRIGDRRIARHSGWFAAHRSHLLVDPDAGIGVIVFSNADNARPASIAEALYELALTLEATSDSP